MDHENPRRAWPPTARATGSRPPIVPGVVLRRCRHHRAARLHADLLSSAGASRLCRPLVRVHPWRALLRVDRPPRGPGPPRGGAPGASPSQPWARGGGTDPPHGRLRCHCGAVVHRPRLPGGWRTPAHRLLLWPADRPGHVHRLRRRRASRAPAPAAPQAADPARDPGGVRGRGRPGTDHRCGLQLCHARVPPRARRVRLALQRPLAPADPRRGAGAHGRDIHAGCHRREPTVAGARACPHPWHPLRRAAARLAHGATGHGGLCPPVPRATLCGSGPVPRARSRCSPRWGSWARPHCLRHRFPAFP